MLLPAPDIVILTKISPILHSYYRQPYKSSIRFYWRRKKIKIKKHCTHMRAVFRSIRSWMRLVGGPSTQTYRRTLFRCLQRVLIFWQSHRIPFFFGTTTSWFSRYTSPPQKPKLATELPVLPAVTAVFFLSFFFYKKVFYFDQRTLSAHPVKYLRLSPTYQAYCKAQTSPILLSFVLKY